jgi:hypothetical protein
MHARVIKHAIVSIGAMIKESKLHVDDAYRHPMTWLDSRTHSRGPLDIFSMSHPYFQSDAKKELRKVSDWHFGNLADTLRYARNGWDGQEFVVAFGAICYRPQEGLFVACLAPGENNRGELQLLKMQGDYPEIFGRDQRVLYVQIAQP